MATLTMLRNNLNHSSGSLPLERDPSSDKQPALAQIYNNNNNKEPLREQNVDTNNNGSMMNGKTDDNKTTRMINEPATTKTKRRSSSVSSTNSIPPRSQYAMVLVLTSLNKTFEKKSLVLPFAPEVLKLGRQTNAKTVPSPDNGYFDSRVLSRQHAEVWADRETSKVYIKDAKSSNGTYINNERLSTDNTESEPHELKKNDILELGIDISNDDGSTLIHKKISAKVERVSIMSLTPQNEKTHSINNINNNNNNINNANNNNNINSNVSNNVNIINTVKFNTANSLTLLNGYNRKIDPVPKPDSLDVALFGDVDSSLEDLIMGHARKSVGGLFMYSGISSSIQFESAVKKLISEIRQAKIEGAKLNSVASLLKEIKKNQSKSSTLANIANQLTAKDERLSQVEKQLADKEQVLKDCEIKMQSLENELEEYKLEQQKYNDLQRQKLNNEELQRQLELTLTELAETKSQLEMYRTRTKSAEEIALKSSTTIQELIRTIEEQRQSQLSASSSPNVDKASTSSPQSPTPTHSRKPSSATTTRTATSTRYNQSKMVPMTSALGVVLFGVGIMALINTLSRER